MASTQKVKKIIVKIPTKINDWLFNFGHGGTYSKRKTVAKLYNSLEKRILRLFSCDNSREKRSIVIKMDNDVVNESCDSQNPHYLLWCLACFLGNFLEKKFVREKIKKYKEEGQQG